MREDTDLLAAGLREEDRVGTGIDRPLESTSASLFERGTVFTENSHTEVDEHRQPDSFNLDKCQYIKVQLFIVNKQIR